MAYSIPSLLSSLAHDPLGVAAVAVLAASLATSIICYRRLRRNVRFLLEATDNGDFAYRFQTHAIGLDNSLLNHIVSTLGKISDEMHQRDKYFELLIASVETGIIVVDEYDCIVQHNKAALRLTGLAVLTHIRQLPPFDSSRLAVRTSSLTLHGHPVRIIALSDISREMEAKEMESWERITRVLTHEIMNSLTPIVSIASHLDGEGAGTIASTARHLMHFVDNYRRFSGALPVPDKRLFYIKPFLEKIVGLHSDAPITLTVEPNDMLVHTDEALAARVVMNIVKNAVETEAMHIAVHAYVSEDEDVVVDVSNDGPMIAPDEAEQIFVPFYTTRSQGSGIGLPLSRRIMQHLGGTLSLKSDTESRLTVFSIVFAG